MKFISAIVRAVSFGILAAFCATGLTYMFWAISEGTLDLPPQMLPRWEQIFFAADFVVGFAVVAVMVFILDLKKRRNPANPYSGPK